MGRSEENPVRIAVFSLGGTISMTPPSEGGPVVPTLTSAELLAAVPGLADAPITVEAHDFRRLPSATLMVDDLLDLAAQIEARTADGVQGVVVTQGTDTIEETAFLLDSVWAGSAPVVVTGAMRGPTLAGHDGPANLLAAIQVAASPHAAGLGCVVVMSDEIHAARYVRKTHTASTGAFASPNTGPMGYVVEGEARILTRPADRITVAGARRGGDARTALLTVGLGDDGELLRGVEDRFAGLVVAGVGAGHVPACMVEVVERVASKIPVVLASRTGAGPVLTATYGYPGSESDLLGRGLIPAGFLDAYKARILLHLLLVAGADRDEIRRTFAAVDHPVAG